MPIPIRYVTKRFGGHVPLSRLYKKVALLCAGSFFFVLYGLSYPPNVVSGDILPKGLHYLPSFAKNLLSFLALAKKKSAPY